MAYHEDVDRYEDILLDYHDIQLLSSLEGVIAFFGKLRYNIDDHLAQTTAAMDFTSEQMRTPIKHIERIASHTDFDSFSIYLFELTRMTFALPTEIVKNFRNRPGNYLLVLTDDYERLDFVLVERYTQTITTQTDWAIVTNGIIWRLYAAKAHSRATNYYEVNLQETLALDPSKREEAFRYFWLFFRAAA